MVNLLAAFLVRPIMQKRNAKKLAVLAPNGIREERFINVGGIEQWITIRGQDRRNPILLVLHGGPGSPYTPFNSWLLDWEQYFTIVQWDQRGGGMTFKKNGPNGCRKLTFDRLAADGILLTEYLCQHLNQKKIILLGSSLGSLVGLKIIHQRPDLFWAYVGTEQNSPDSNSLAYELTKQAAQKIKDKKGLTLLEAMGNDSSRWTRQQLEAMNKLAIKASKDVPNMISDLMLPALLFSPDYTMRDISIIQKGMEFSMQELFTKLISFDIKTLGYEIKVPFFIFQGEGDILTPVATAKAYFDCIKAPHKEFVLIKHAGHLAEFANPQQFLKELIDRVRPLAVSQKL